jgi:hypothetical protein
MDPRAKTSTAALEKKFHAESHLASLLTRTSNAVLEGNALREQLEKQYSQPSEPVQAFAKKLSALLGSPGGFLAPPSTEMTLTRLNAECNTLYQQLWQVDAEPTSSQMQALAAVEHDQADVLKRWNDLKANDLALLNRQLRDSKQPELRPEPDPHHEESQLDEE